MSSSMPIPARKPPTAMVHVAGSSSSSSSSLSSSASSSSYYSTSPPPPPSAAAAAAAAWKGKSKVPITHSSTPPHRSRNSSSSSSSRLPEHLAASPARVYFVSPRRPSLMGTSLSKSEYTVVNLGHEDGPPRLVSCVKRSQGFDWNQELFLPSYVASEYADEDLEHRADPVEEIVLTEEEAEALLPR